jgi:hypothetical protein
VTKLSQATIDAIGAAVAAAFAAQAAAPVAPPAAREEKPSAAFGGKTFTEYVSARNAARVACEIESHAGICDRTFSPKSSGVTNHVARLG